MIDPVVGATEEVEKKTKKVEAEILMIAKMITIITGTMIEKGIVIEIMGVTVTEIREEVIEEKGLINKSDKN